MRKIAVIPAYEPPESFAFYAAQVLKMTDALVVVNDGSSQEYDAVFDRIKHLEGAAVLSHDKNMGKGYALKHAFSYCLTHFASEDILVTADCDGQHALADVIAVCDAAAQQTDACVLGVRDFTQANVPARSKAGNTQTLRLLRWLFSLELTDSQTGLRAFPVNTAREFLKIGGNRFEYETGMLIYAKRNHIPIREVPIRTIYPENPEDHVSHYKTFRDSCRILGTMLRYLSGSMLSGLLATAGDLAVFSLLTYVVFPKISPIYTLFATVCGKIVASLINFGVNCKYVFHGKARQSVGRFYIVWLGQLLLSYGNIWFFGHVLGGHLTLMKLIGDFVLALFTYKLQCNWVYEAPKAKDGFWGRYARFARWAFRSFSRRYKTDIQKPDEPVVYVCRHLNMHGPYTTLKRLPFDVHPMIIHMYFDRKKTVDHMTQYTFAERYGKKPRKFNLAAHVMSWIAPPLMQSLQGVPVYRESTKSISTIKCALKYLLQGDSLIIYPDVDYTGSYEKPSEIYDGFLFIGELYFKKTGKLLRFVPLIIDEQTRQICEGEPVTLCNYRKEGADAARKLKQAINIRKGEYHGNILYPLQSDGG